MNIVFFAHPTFLGSQSMPRFANMLLEGMKSRGFNVKLMSPQAYLFRIPAPRVIRKWFGYIDQYIIFPLAVKKQLKELHPHTLFVFTDHALGPWVPLVAHHAHVIHCHDFLAQQSAKKLISANETGWLGRQYQAFIHRGYSRGKHFISVSEKTRRDLHSFLTTKPLHSEVVYNGLNQVFSSHDPLIARTLFSKHVELELTGGYWLHVGRNQWYKNRRGVIEIYNAWRLSQQRYLPLIMIGKKPDSSLREIRAKSPFNNDIHLIENLPDSMLPFAYAGASVFLFPSLAEGFGWPIAEAMACGCPVVTTNMPPMTEVAAKAGFLIPVRPDGNEHQTSAWAMEAAAVINKVIDLGPRERVKVVEKGLVNSERFDSELALYRIEKIYRKVWRDHAKQDRNFGGRISALSVGEIESNHKNNENTSCHTLL